MRAEALARIDALPDDARVLDVGGWAAPMARADVVLDLFPYATRGLYGDVTAARHDAASWVEADVCGPAPWPFADDEFDVAVCSHTLEDVRDPVFVCAELQRVARSGYVEVPAPVEELSAGVHGPWVGWSHHRWITEREGDGLVFTHKPHLLGAPGRHLPPGAADRVPDAERVLALWWEGTLPAREAVHVDAGTFDGWLEGLLRDAAARAGVGIARDGAPGAGDAGSLVGRARRAARARLPGRLWKDQRR